MRKFQRNAYVVFTGKTNIWYLHFLKKEYKHCFLLLEDNSFWLSFDPLSSHTEIEIISKDKNIFLPDWMISQGFKIVKANFNETFNHSAPMAIINCVESIKRILGIHNFMIMTPYQLFKYLKKTSNKEN